MPYGVVRLLIGLVFSIGLIMVVIGGAELFTGSNIIVMAWASGKVTTRALLLNWVISFAGNFVGAIATAVLMFYTTQYTFGGGAVGLDGAEHGKCQNVAGLHSGTDPRDHVQCAGVPGGVDVFQRAHDH